MLGKKKLRLVDILGLAISSFISVEVIASQASLGPSLIFCMLTIGLIYLVCHGLICAELGAAYPDQGGVYVWVEKAFGSRWAARTSWWYWVNVVAFLPCTLVAMLVVLQQVFWPDMSVLTTTVLSIIGTWLIIIFNLVSLRESKGLTNLGTVMKLLICVVLVIGAIYALFHGGSQNEFSAATILPTFDMKLLALIPVYIYGLTGLDLLSANAGEMENPRRDIPKSLLVAGIVMILVYTLCAASVLIILPIDGIDPASGAIDALIQVYGASRFLVILFVLAFVIIYLSYTFSWTIAGNAVAQEAAECGDFPAVFAWTNKHNAPVGPAVILGIASTVMLLVYGFTTNSNSDLFWTLLAFTSIIFFLPYIVIPFALLKLRKSDPETERPIRIPGKALPYVVCILQAILIGVGVVGYILPPEGEEPVSYMIIMVLGLVLSQVVGEVLLRYAEKKKAKGAGKQ